MTEYAESFRGFFLMVLKVGGRRFHVLSDNKGIMNLFVTVGEIKGCAERQGCTGEPGGLFLW